MPNPHRHTVTAGTQTHRELDSDRDKGENTGGRERELAMFRMENYLSEYYSVHSVISLQF